MTAHECQIDTIALKPAFLIIHRPAILEQQIFHAEKIKAVIGAGNSPCHDEFFELCLYRTLTGIAEVNSVITEIQYGNTFQIKL